jgi:sec-independent protein translocase protein TatC
MSQAEQPLISHLVELRTRLLRAISAILLVFIALIYFSNNIYDFVAQPLLSQLPAGTSMIATDVATPSSRPSS